MEAAAAMRIEAVVTGVINYALQQNGLPVVASVRVFNDTGADVRGAVLRIWSEPELTLRYERAIDLIPADAPVELRAPEVAANGQYLCGLTERVSGRLRFALTCGGQVLARHECELTALAFDEWHGTTFFPELLAAFVTPNHPEVIKINAQAAQLLEKWSGDPSLTAYQSRSRDRVLMQAAAVYASLQAQNIVYCVPPASFEPVGQRVRLCDAVMQQKMGTCLDLTLFYASCLEAIGLHPLLLIKRGHILAGLWLEELSFPEAAEDDPALVTKRLADGVGEIAAVECTALVAGKSVGFDEASSAGVHQLTGPDSIEYIIDIKRARLSGVRPLPLRVRDGAGWRVETPARPARELSAAPSAAVRAAPVSAQPRGPVGKLEQWERKLLDLGLRNSLINLRITSSVVPLIIPAPGELEDALADGGEYVIAPRPAEWKPREGGEDIESIADTAPYAELIRSEFKSRRLRSALGEGELARAVVGLYRSARTSLEENGANTLYLALGALRWYESRASRKPRYAPVVLFPVELVRRSARGGYVVRLRDDEPQMNITLLEMLRQDFGIDVGGLDPLPQDEHGVDMLAVFTTLRRAVMSQGRWDVIESALLGIFSFSQFVMWNDMRNRSADLAKNRIVRSLMDGRLSWQAQPMEMGARVPEDGVLLPLPADASQLYAIEAAAGGASFVLHGPPGTGKSQTITALIANLLAQGKTVLFVAEKMAALSVVQRRLNSLGIGPFCLELHSNKSRKRDVLDQLQAATEVTRLRPSDAYAKKADQTAALRAELDAYARALHAPRPCGHTLYELIAMWQDVREADGRVRFPAAFAAQATEELLAVQLQAVDRLTAAGRAVGRVAGHPLAAVGRTAYSQQLRTALPDALDGYRAALDALERAGAALAQVTSLPAPSSWADWERFSGIAGGLLAWGALPRAWARYPDMAAAMRDIQALCRVGAAADELHAGLLASGWREGVFSLDARALKAEWDAASGKWFLAKNAGQSKIVKLLAPYSAAAPRKETLGDTLAALVRYADLRAQADPLMARYGAELGAMAAAPVAWASVSAMAAQAADCAARLFDLTGGDALRTSCAGLPAAGDAARAFASAFDAACGARAGLYKLLELRLPSSRAPWLDVQRELCSSLEAHSGELREWMMWNAACAEARSHALDPVVSAYAAGLDHDDVSAAYRKALYECLISHVVDSEPALSSFTGSMFNEKIAQFRRMDAELTDLARTEIFCRLAARVPNFSVEAAHSSEVGILQRAIRSGGRGLSLRSLFSQIPTLLPRLCPCMLMSPISAAQYLDPKRAPFDVVVFDEASQIPTCKAVGALARGTSAVIVGDPKQMPPTSFFSTNTVDEEALDTEDLESILDDCLALNMPQTHLLWHYRSRHESLIAFSNRHFYENKLFTFPSVNDRASRVTLRHVDGCFERGKNRQNRAEAEAVVAELVRRSRDGQLSGQSVGVVTFNINQQNLIDDLFTEACRSDPALDAWAYESDEPLFIKNLENVQGDERDVILFSVSYGPDENGRVYMNFGPLNREGGWRRLNVAVSRARQEMTVFSTLRAEQIDLGRSSAAGVAALKAFLEYADGAALATGGEDDADASPLSRSGTALAVCRALEEHGYAAQRLVGHSAYRIDVGVVDPRDPERYLLGILLDGPVYGQARTTRDRETAQQSVLTGLGWELHRLWTMDWWENSGRELERLLERVGELESQPPRADAPKAQPKPPEAAVSKENAEAPATEPLAAPSAALSSAYRPEAMPQAPAAQPYAAAVLRLPAMTADDYMLPQKARQLQSAFAAVIQAEAPISEALLVRRVLQAAGITRASSRVQSRSAELLTGIACRITDQNGERFFWRADQDPAVYSSFRATGTDADKREAKDLPWQEAANAVCAVLEAQLGLQKDALVREAAKLLGYTRMGSVVTLAMESGVRLAIAAGRIGVDTDTGYLTLKR